MQMEISNRYWPFKSGVLQECWDWKYEFRRRLAFDVMQLQVTRYSHQGKQIEIEETEEKRSKNHA